MHFAAHVIDFTARGIDFTSDPCVWIISVGITINQIFFPQRFIHKFLIITTRPLDEGPSTTWEHPLAWNSSGERRAEIR